VTKYKSKITAVKHTHCLRTAPFLVTTHRVVVISYWSLEQAIEVGADLLSWNVCKKLQLLTGNNPEERRSYLLCSGSL